MRSRRTLASPMTRPPTRSASSPSDPSTRSPSGRRRGRGALDDAQSLLDVGGDVHAAVADAFARHDELQSLLSCDRSCGLANLLRELIGDRGVLAPERRQFAEFLGLSGFALEDRRFVRIELRLIVLEGLPVRGDARDVDDADGAVRRAACGREDEKGYGCDTDALGVHVPVLSVSRVWITSPVRSRAPGGGVPWVRPRRRACRRDEPRYRRPGARPQSC